MGITGLLPFLEKATKPCHISEFRGGTVVIDSYCWLHKGANACAVQLAQGEETNAYVNYCLKYVRMLQSFDIRPILVFDGKNLPAKADTESKRRESRAKAKQRAAELLRLGKTQEARTYLKQCINITPEMASALIKECHKINVDCIVAPYESDAQLAFFNIKGIAEVVITEDSDLLLFGCTKVLYKLDLQGTGQLVEAEKIPLTMKLRPDKYTFDKFRFMCILSGCDYVDSLHGIGLKKALKFFTLTDETDPEIFLGNVPRYLNMRHLQVSDEYKENFMKANATFLHQIVFDPFKKKLVPLYDPYVCGTNIKYCDNAGEIIDNDIAFEVALGNLHPTTHKRLDDWCPDNVGPNSIWSGVYKKCISRKQQKAEFRSFFKTEMKNETTVDDEQIKSIEDDKIKQELQFYTRKSEQDNEVIETKPVKMETNVAEEKTSPVLKSNPFIKRFSKFPRTQSCSNVIVKSRYFSSNIPESTDVKCEVENEQKMQTFSQPNISEISEDVSDNCDINIVIDDDDTDENESPMDINVVQNVNTPMCSNVNDDEKVHSNSAKSQTVSIPKRKLIGECRSVGLKRTKSEVGQQKISEFFNKFRKT